MVIFHSYVSLPEGKFYLKDSSANSAGSLRNVVRNVVNTISLVGGLEHLDFIFSRIYGIIIPTDFHIFQDGYCTTNQFCLRWDEISSGEPCHGGRFAAGCGHWPSGYQRFMHWQNVWGGQFSRLSGVSRVSRPQFIWS